MLSFNSFSFLFCPFHNFSVGRVYFSTIFGYGHRSYFDQCLSRGNSASTMSSHLWQSMIIGEKRMYTCMCNWVTMLYSRKKKLYWGNNNNNKKKLLSWSSSTVAQWRCLQNKDAGLIPSLVQRVKGSSIAVGYNCHSGLIPGQGTSYAAGWHCSPPPKKK